MSRLQGLLSKRDAYYIGDQLPEVLILGLESPQLPLRIAMGLCEELFQLLHLPT